MGNTKGSRFALKVSEEDDDVAYLHPAAGPCRMSRSVRLRDVMGAYPGPDVVLDFDLHGTLVGIEILA